MDLTTTTPTLPVQIMSLGGLGEIGKNTWAFRYQDEILLLDGGLSFPTEDMLGVNIVLPDMTWLIENQKHIVGMVVTHGHEDHIGGIPYHLKQFRIPRIWGPKLAMALLQPKLKEHGLLNQVPITTVGPRDVVKAGKHFSVEYIQNTHSIADSYTLAIRTPAGVIIHSGDFKFDHTPVDGRKFDYHRLAEYGEAGVLCLISDSTNAELPGFTPSERSVYPNLDRVFSQAKGRIVLTTFASSVHRVNMVLQLAQKHGRVVSLLGRSMHTILTAAKQVGFISYPEELLQPLQVCQKLPDKEVLILTTGSQGEPLAALTRIAQGEHRQFSIKAGDTVVFSANPIPGNTISVVKTIDRLMQLGAEVIYGKDKGIHVSGHGCQEDHKLMLALTKPKYFLPAHGELRMLRIHCQTAQAVGVPAENMVIAMNGDVVEVSQSGIRIAGKIPSGLQLIDQVGIVDRDALRDRQRISDEGLVLIAVAVDHQGQVSVEPTVTIRGMARIPGMINLEADLAQAMVHAVRDQWRECQAILEDGRTQIDWDKLQSLLSKIALHKLRDRVPSRPLVIVQMLKPTGNAPTAALPETNGTGAHYRAAIIEAADTEVALPGRIRRRTTTSA